MALLHELVREKGRMGAAAALGIDRRTVAASIRGGKPSWRVREALERALQSGAGSAASRQRERNDALEQRIETLAGEMRSTIEDIRTAVEGKIKATQNEQAKALRSVERRLTKLETPQHGVGTEHATTTARRPVVSVQSRRSIASW